MKKVLLILVLALTLALSGCTGDNAPIVDNSGMDEEDVLREIKQELHDFVVSNGFDDMIQSCDNADTPDSIGGLGDTDCEEMITWYADNWEEIYMLLNYELDWFENALIEHYYNKEQVDSMFYSNEEHDDAWDELNEYIMDLEQRITELETQLD